MQEYLETLAKFPTYSCNNSILIYLQNPKASLIMGRKRWLNEFNRTIDDSDPIKIWAPTKKSVTKFVYKRNPKTKEILLDGDGNKILEEIPCNTLNWVLVDVYDVSQTTGDPIKELDHNLQKEVMNFNDYKEAIISSAELPVEFKNFSGLANGFCDSKGITIKESLSEVQTLNTLVHELAHSKLHFQGVEQARESKELEAEAIAYTVLCHYGIDTSEHSFLYLASWSSNKDVKVLKDCLSTIQKTSKTLISTIDQNLDKIKNERLHISQKSKEKTIVRY